MYKKNIRAAGLILIFSCLSVQSWAAPSAVFPLEITDSIGNKITIEKKPERIVLAGRATLITANAFYLFREARKNVIAVGHTDQGLGNFLPYLDKNFNNLIQLPHEVGPEQIISQHPDLVIVKDFIYKRLGPPLKKLGIPVVALSLESAEAFQTDIGILGRALGYPGRAEEIQSLLRQRIETVESRISTLREDEKPRVLLLYYSVKGGASSYNIAPKSWIQTHQVEAAGGRAVWADSHMGNGWKTVNFEQIAVWDPDYIFITSYRMPVLDVFEKIRGNNQWELLRAMKSGRVLPFPADFYSWAQPDVRWILGTQWLAGVLHPDLFAETDMMKETESFYLEMYDLDPSVFRSVVAPRITGIND